MIIPDDDGGDMQELALYKHQARHSNLMFSPPFFPSCFLLHSPAEVNSLFSKKKKKQKEKKKKNATLEYYAE